MDGELDAVALLAASYHGLMGEVIRGVLGGAESQWYEPMTT